MKTFNRIALVLIIALVALWVNNNRATLAATAEERAAASQQQRETWQRIASRLEAHGNGEVTVSPMNDPAIMRIAFSGTLRQQMTPYDARKIARSVFIELGGAPFIRVTDDTGKTLAIASSSGVE